MLLTEPMIMFALRYCLTSASYAPGACTRYLREHWAEFPPQLQAQIREEIQERLVIGTLDAALAATWEEFLQYTMEGSEA
jgi:hypothetical protein